MSSSSGSTETSGANGRAPAPPPKRRDWLWLVLFAVVLLAFVRAASMEGGAPPPVASESVPDPLLFIVCMVALFVAPPLIWWLLGPVVVCFGARWVGLEDAQVRLGALHLRLDGGAFSMARRHAPAGAPLVASVVVPPVERPWRWWAVILCGNLGLPLLWLLTSLWVLGAVGPTEAPGVGPMKIAAFVLPLGAAVFTALRLLPAPLPVSRLGPGAVWRALRDGGPGAAQERGIEQIISASVAGRRPRDWPPEALAALTDVESPRRMFAAAYRLQWALDTQRWDEALSLIQSVLARPEAQALADPGSLALMMAWLKASHSGPLGVGAARSWLADAGDRPAAPGLRELASAAIALAEGETAQAAAHAVSGRAALHASGAENLWLEEALQDVERAASGRTPHTN